MEGNHDQMNIDHVLRQITDKDLTVRVSLLEVQTVIITVYCVLCACCSFSAFLWARTTAPQGDSAFLPAVSEPATSTPRPTRPPRPTKAPVEPTSASKPSPVSEESTPPAETTPTPEPTPPPPDVIAPPYQEIYDNMHAMTEAQWNKYADELEGKQVTRWTGWVEEVNEKTLGGYELWIDMDPPEAFSTQDVVFDIPDDVALEINKDQAVTFSGTIESVSEARDTLIIRLENPEWSLDDQ
jgi:hypothetical protein